MLRRPPGPTLFPYATLFRSRPAFADAIRSSLGAPDLHVELIVSPDLARDLRAIAAAARASRGGPVDRKSTRLNSSHQIISYAVFCLKKKKAPHITHRD